MASIKLEVEIGDLENGQLDHIEDKFETWLRNAYRSTDAPDGHIDFVAEIDREEDNEEENQSNGE